MVKLRSIEDGILYAAQRLVIFHAIVKTSTLAEAAEACGMATRTMQQFLRDEGVPPRGKVKSLDGRDVRVITNILKQHDNRLGDIGWDPIELGA